MSRQFYIRCIDNNFSRLLFVYDDKIRVPIQDIDHVGAVQFSFRGVLADPTKWNKLQLVKKISVNYNTNLYRFALPSSEDALRFPTGKHVNVRCPIDGTLVERSYTPVTTVATQGHFDLLIKTYANGNISKRMDQLKIGDFVEMSGPRGRFAYTMNMVDHIGMVAGGIGVTPMVQIIRTILGNPQDKTRVDLIFANKTLDDILLFGELKRLSQKNGQSFRMYNVLEQAPSGWSEGVGLVTKEMIEKYMPKPGPKTKILICGPPPMVKIVSDHCNRAGFDPAQTVSRPSDMVYKF